MVCQSHHSKRNHCHVGTTQRLQRPAAQVWTLQWTLHNSGHYSVTVFIAYDATALVAWRLLEDKGRQTCGYRNSTIFEKNCLSTQTHINGPVQNLPAQIFYWYCNYQHSENILNLSIPSIHQCASKLSHRILITFLALDFDGDDLISKLPCFLCCNKRKYMVGQQHHHSPSNKENFKVLSEEVTTATASTD